ncbi:MAG: hypothetical protein IPP94_12975 [Ignavibacteria bacterium]|nr:hypothetical protein [Ignavibacteria bacterium]
MKTILSVMTMLALTFSLATAGVKEDPKKVGEKKESACCSKEAKVAKTEKSKDCCAGMSKADKAKCGTGSSCDHAKAEKTEKTDATVKPTSDKN